MIVYIAGDLDTRHNCTDGENTLCGQRAVMYEPLALPVNCDPCRIAAGRLMRAAYERTLAAGEQS